MYQAMWKNKRFVVKSAFYMVTVFKVLVTVGFENNDAEQCNHLDIKEKLLLCINRWKKLITTLIVCLGLYVYKRDYASQ